MQLKQRNVRPEENLEHSPLGFCSVATYSFLPRVVQQYKELQPGVQLLLKEMNPPQQEVAFLRRGIDAGITRLPFRKAGS